MRLGSRNLPANPAIRTTPAATAEGRRRTLLFAAIVGCLILVGALGFWLYSRTYESTDDAQVDGHLNGITARIDGDVKAVHVEENQSVQGGTTCSSNSTRAITKLPSSRPRRSF